MSNNFNNSGDNEEISDTENNQVEKEKEPPCCPFCGEDLSNKISSMQICT